MTQWHPIFAFLLRHAMQDFYEVQTNVPVGDLPREADIILVRRTTTSKPPFRTLWKHLTRWNVLEFKGRSESARVGDIDLLLEVGLGIHRRLREQEPNIKVARRDVSFWYLANHLGKRFLRDVVELIGNVELVAPGLWRGQTVGRPIWLVSNSDVPVDLESAPVRLVSGQTLEQTRALAQIVVQNDELWQQYASWVAILYPEFAEEFRIMASKRNKGEIDLSANIRRVLRELGPGRQVELGLMKDLLEDVGTTEFLAQLSPDQRAELSRALQAESEKKKGPPK
jgi:hypothetical protein